MLEEKARFPVGMMARTLGVSRSGFYAWLGQGAPQDDWAETRGAVHRVWLESDGRFGARFVKCFMPDDLQGTTLYRIRKCMRELGIRGCMPYKPKRTTIPDRNAKPRPDLIRRDFTSPVPTYKLVGDITYLRTGQGWLYLATVIDLNTRMVVGWSLSERMTADTVVMRSDSDQPAGTSPRTRSSTQTKAPSTPAGCSPNGPGPTTCACRAAAPATARQRRRRVVLRCRC
ncbi:DDE-type integrase/transposase/recombinase [Slackia isoflavoniconvertens]|uniref:DDE-type integrase/transposase/recombinase n=1 Tax=Slackia isoflavoniconvertens TaxID=572010 RepID=UPI003FD8BFE7